jgi:hypothetical protein
MGTHGRSGTSGPFSSTGPERFVGREQSLVSDMQSLVQCSAINCAVVA